MIGPSNNWELETRRILQEKLPEYDIDPHMRLANVVKGRIRFVMAMSQYEVDFTVRDKQTGQVICAIELDGPTHDTLDGQRRDGNKNRWLAEAGIKLVRLRHPDEANDIRALMEMANIPYIPPIPRKFNPKEKYLSRLLLKIGIAVASVFAVLIVINNSLNNINRSLQNNLAKQAQQVQQRMDAQRAAVKPKIQAGDADNLTKVIHPRYERVLVRGKSARECARPDGTLDDYTVQCMHAHYENVLVTDSR